MEIDRSSTRDDGLGEVEVDGVAYRIRESSGNTWEVIRSGDGRRVGELRGSPSLMWLLEAEEIDVAILRDIVLVAIEEGLLVELASD